jgi:hypothetical protein
MTFLLSEISHFGIIMASDSSETRTSSQATTFVDVDKTHYFPDINVGISTWGYATVGNQSIDSWLTAEVNNFAQVKSSDEILSNLTKHLGQRLIEAFHLDGSRRNGHIRMGLHIAGYNSDTLDAPGLCHVFIDQGDLYFTSQETQLYLPEHVPAMHLRNGILDEYSAFNEFAIMWPALFGIHETFRNLIYDRYHHKATVLQDPLVMRAEYLGNWIRQLCLVVKMAGIPEYIGKSVRVLVFEREGNPRRYELPEMHIC